jgi:hypothetical protein
MTSSIQPKPVRVFDRENPCTKVELFNCFWGKSGWRPRAVIEARGEIGENAPKYLLKKGYARTFQRQFVDWYERSETGKVWLVEGLGGHLKRHPEDWAKLSVKDAVVTLIGDPGHKAAQAETVRRITGTRRQPTEPVLAVPAKRLSRKR